MYIAAANSLDEHFIVNDTVQLVIQGINDGALPTVVPQTTPKPGSLMLLGAGVIDLAGMLRHGFKV